ncbi:MAG: hypothetical protein K2G09_01610 [Paramuribaculum sp.]|nr:hypothetical protein [Paramuribaculum sp.]
MALHTGGAPAVTGLDNRILNLMSVCIHHTEETIYPLKTVAAVPQEIFLGASQPAIRSVDAEVD